MTRAQRAAFVGLVLFTTIAVVHVPLVTIEEDSIGLFDVTLIGLAIVLLIGGAHIGSTISARPALHLYLIFLLYITAGFLLGMLRSDAEFFGFALLVKQYEYLLIALIAGYFAAVLPRRSFLVPLGLVLFIVAITGAIRLVGSEYKRLGLVFQEGNSPNPAGFILATTLLLLVTEARPLLHERRLIGKAWFGSALVVGYAALVLTFSRTNNLAFVIALVFYLIQKNRRALIVGGITLGGLLLLLTILPSEIGINIYGGACSRRS